MKKQKKQPTDILVYVGPTIPGVATTNTIYNNGITKELEAAAQNEPAFNSLIISLSKLAEAKENIANRQGAVYEFYKKALNYKA
jgi:hypothetical protein